MTTLGIADWGGPAQPFRIETRQPVVHRPGASFSRDGSGNMPVVTKDSTAGSAPSTAASSAPLPSG